MGVSFFNNRFVHILIWMLGASQVAVVVGSILFSFAATIGTSGTLIDLGGTLIAVAIVAAVGVNLVVIFVAYPIRLVWKRKLSVAFMAIGSALAGGLVFSGQMAFTAYEAFYLKTGVQIGDGSTFDAVWGVTALFMIGALYGGLFGLSYGVLETFPRYDEADEDKFEDAGEENVDMEE